MSNRFKQISILVLLGFYCSLLYFIVNYYQRIDFPSFYLSSHALLKGDDPYQNFLTTYMPTEKILPANLNPPFVLWSFMFLARFSYANALLIWFFSSLVLGIIGITISFYYAFSTRFLQKNYVNLYLLYFASFPTLTNLLTQQFGSILLFLIMLGYYFYLNHRDYLAGILWGIIISMKLFPALLFFYVLKQDRKKIFVAMLATVLITTFLPLLINGPMLYKQYFKMIGAVFWYGDDWNASIYGFIYRLFFGGEIRPKMSDLIPINLFYGVLFVILLIWYWRKLGPTERDPINHQPFCLTLAMMLFLSPFGWVYYFPVLFLPMALTWFVAADEESTSAKTMFLWLLCLFLINFPIDYMTSQHMSNFLWRISILSPYFYGLLLLIYLLGKRKNLYGEIQLDGTKDFSIPPMIIIFVFGAVIPIIYFVIRLLEMV